MLFQRRLFTYHLVYGHISSRLEFKYIFFCINSIGNECLYDIQATYIINNERYEMICDSQSTKLIMTSSNMPMVLFNISCERIHCSRRYIMSDLSLRWYYQYSLCTYYLTHRIAPVSSVPVAIHGFRVRFSLESSGSKLDFHQSSGRPVVCRVRL